MSKNKRNISVRLSESDIRKIKDIADRFGVKESELFRYGVKCMLTKLMPFNDSNLRGADLIPAWLESGEELLTYFHIDTDQLEEIFNRELSASDKPLDPADLDLMVLSNLNEKFVVKRLSEICGMPLDHSEVQVVLRQYLYDKYILGGAGDSLKADPDWRGLIESPIVNEKKFIKQ